MFAETLAEHNANVYEHQVLYFRAQGAPDGALTVGQVAASSVERVSLLQTSARPLGDENPGYSMNAGGFGSFACVAMSCSIQSSALFCFTKASTFCRDARD